MRPEDFVQEYEAALKTQYWKNIEPLFHDNVCVTFSNGAIHRGKSEVKMAFENNFSVIKSEEYSIQNVQWVLKNDTIAAFVFEFYWKGLINKTLTKGNGIGTIVLVRESEKWTLLTENLSKQTM